MWRCGAKSMRYKHEQSSSVIAKINRHMPPRHVQIASSSILESVRMQTNCSARAVCSRAGGPCARHKKVTTLSAVSGLSLDTTQAHAVRQLSEQTSTYIAR